MIRRLIILLLIVGCDNEPEGVCIKYIGQGDYIFGESDTVYTIPIEFTELNVECNDNNTLDECCYIGYFGNDGGNGAACKGGITAIMTGNTSFPDSMLPAYPIPSGIVISKKTPEWWIEGNNCSDYCADTSNTCSVISN